MAEMKYIVSESKLVNLADAVREKAGTTDPLTIDDMIAQVKGIKVGGRSDAINALLDKSIETAECDVYTIREYSFYGCQKLTSVSLSDKCSGIKYNAFSYCCDLQEIDLSRVWYIESAFYGCTSLPEKIEIGTNGVNHGFNGGYYYGNIYVAASSTFMNCHVKTVIIGHDSIPVNTCIDLGGDIEVIDVSALNSLSFYYASARVAAFVIRNTFEAEGVKQIPSLDVGVNTKPYTNFYFYVPDDDISLYKESTNWASMADHIKPLSELPAEYDRR